MPSRSPSRSRRSARPSVPTRSSSSSVGETTMPSWRPSPTPPPRDGSRSARSPRVPAPPAGPTSSRHQLAWVAALSVQLRRNCRDQRGLSVIPAQLHQLGSPGQPAAGDVRRLSEPRDCASTTVDRAERVSFRRNCTSSATTSNPAPGSTKPRTPAVSGARRVSRSAGDLAGLQAAGAHVETRAGAVDRRADPLDVGVEAPLRDLLRPRPVVAEARLLGADVADGSHGSTPGVEGGTSPLVQYQSGQPGKNI